MHVNIDSVGALGASELSQGHSDSMPAGYEKMFGNGKTGGLGWWWHTTEDTLDKIDPEHLERDCQIYLLTIYQALDAPFIPVDVQAAVDDLSNAIKGWQEKAGDHLDLSTIVTSVQYLQKQVAQLEKLRRTIRIDDVVKRKLANQAVIRILQYVVPLNYVRSHPCEHDLALDQPLVPKLAEIDELITYPRQSFHYQLLKTSCVRKRNQVHYDLKQAIATLDVLIEKISNT